MTYSMASRSTARSTEEVLEARRVKLAAGWRRVEAAAKVANNKIMEAHARHHAELLEDPPVKLGDRVATLTHALGIPQCDGCKRRQAAMNRIDIRKGLLHTIKGIVLSFLP